MGVGEGGGGTVYGRRIYITLRQKEKQNALMIRCQKVENSSTLVFVRWWEWEKRDDEWVDTQRKSLNESNFRENIFLVEYEDIRYKRQIMAIPKKYIAIFPVDSRI